MDNVVSTEILEDIDLVVLESTINVFDALLNEYEKTSIILETADEEMHPGFSLFQEESVIDYATGKHSGDSTFMKIVKFIPRLFIGIIRAIASVFTKDAKSKTDKSFDNAKTVIEKASPEQLTTIATEVNKRTDSKINFDPNKKTFTIGRGFRHIKNSIFILLSAPKILKTIIAQCKQGNTDYKLLAKDLWSILKGDKKADELTTSLSMTALKDLLNDAWAASTAISAISDEVSMHLEKKMKKDFANGKNIEKQAAAKELFDGLKEVTKHVSNVTTFGRIARGVIDFLGQDVSRFAGSVLSKVPGIGKLDAVKNMRDSGRTGTENIVDSINKKKAKSAATHDINKENKLLRDEASGMIKQEEIESSAYNAEKNAKDNNDRLKSLKKRSELELENNRARIESDRAESDLKRESRVHKEDKPKWRKKHLKYLYEGDDIDES